MLTEYKGIVSKQILMKVSSRGRPDALLTVVSEALRLAGSPNKLNWLFSFDEDDDKMPECVLRISEIIPAAMFRIGQSESKVHAINRDIPADGWDILVNLSDDQLCVTQGWDILIRQAMPVDTDASLWFNDGRQQTINTMEIVGRKYYERFGYIYNPAYKSFFCDQESTDVGLKLGKLIKRNEVLFKHCHPVWTNEKLLTHDETYKRAEVHWNEDQATYNARRGKG